MKIVLLVLSGNAEHARGWLLEKYPGAIVDNIPREQLESGSWSQRRNALRSLRPDIFAVATERLIWQRGQNAMLLFGALGGASRVVLVDARRQSRRNSGRNSRTTAGAAELGGREYSRYPQIAVASETARAVLVDHLLVSPEKREQLIAYLAALSGFSRGWRRDAHQWFRQRGQRTRRRRPSH
jgi:hypothetical protein